MSSRAWFFWALAALVIAGSGATAAAAPAALPRALPRGIRNHNPGNIEWIPDPAKRWRGMVGSDGRYGIFDTPANGVRAIGGELRANFRRGENTLRQIFTEWAPPAENDTESYIRHGERELNVGRDAPLSQSHIPALTAVIIRHENGIQPYAPADVAQWSMAA